MTYYDVISCPVHLSSVKDHLHCTKGPFTLHAISTLLCSVNGHLTATWMLF